MDRFPANGRAGIYRTDDWGLTWHDASSGLPDKDFYSIVLRDALAVDDLDPVGVYFGTRSGEVWSSPDAGQNWSQATAHLPDVLCVRAAQVGVTMNVRLGLPATLADLVGGRRELCISVDGEQATVGQVLDVVGGVHPVLERRIRDETGGLRRYVNVYADGVDIRALQTEQTALSDGAHVLVIPSVAGG